MRSTHPGRLLAQLAQLLGRAACDGAVDAAVGVVIGVDGVELHLRPLTGDGHVAELLCGFDAPAHWDVLGVVAHGRARPIGAHTAGAEPVVVVHLQARSGASCSMLGPPSGPLQPVAELSGGRVLDICRRGLGLATAPPPHHVLQWWAARWLEALAAGPAVELCRTEAELVAAFPGTGPAPRGGFDALDAHARHLGQQGWAALRTAAATAVLPVPGIEPAVAAWMDDGMFARWALDALPSCAACLAELEPRLTAGLSHRLRSLLAGWGAPATDRHGLGG